MENVYCGTRLLKPDTRVVPTDLQDTARAAIVPRGEIACSEMWVLAPLPPPAFVLICSDTLWFQGVA